MNTKAEFLKSVKIFGDLSDEEAKAIQEKLHAHRLKKGETLFRQGAESGGELFVVESGTVGISMTLSDGKELEIVSFSRGDFFGEMSVFEKAPRSASCCAKSRCRLLSLHEAVLFQLMKEQPAVAMKIMNRMLFITRRRMKDRGDFLYETVQWGEEARKRAITDPLTGLYNRRYLDESIKEYLKKAKNSSKPLAFVMLDLDNFRMINEEYSQDIGDKVIIAAAERFRLHLRSTDIAVRYGGDEFTFILPDTEGGTARNIMEAIRSDVETIDILEGLAGSMRKITTSQGIACFPSDAVDAKMLRESADAALYKAKELGRNRIVLAQDYKGG